MPDPTTPAKGLTQPLVGGDNNEWGYLLNTDLALVDTALGGTLTLSITGNTNLTSTQVENTGYEFTGTLSATATITWPAFSGMAAIQNATTGGHSISCGLAGGTFVSIPNGSTYGIWSDGTNFVQLSGVGATTGSGPVVLENSPTIGSPTLTGTVAGAGTIPNSVLVDDAITIAGHIVALGGSQTLAASDLTNGTTGTGSVVLATSPTIASPTFTGTVSGLSAGEISGLAAVATSGSASDLTTGTLPNGRLSAVPNSALANSSVTISSHSLALGGSLALAAGDVSGLAASATTDTTNASNITSGTLPNARLVAVPNSALANSSVTLSGHSLALGGSLALVAGDVSGLAAVATSGSATDLTTGTLPNSRLSAVPNSALANSSITIAGHAVALGGSQALAASDLTNGTTGSGAVVLATSPTVSALNVTGKVGIALGVSPTYNLQVSTSADLLAAYAVNTANSGVALEGQATGTGSTGVIGLGISAGVIGEAGAGGNGVEGLNTSTGIGGFFSSTSGYALLTGNGNVGIGTSSPSVPLEVNGDTKIDGALTVVGIPVGPTAAVGTNTTQFATTAFVQGNQLGVNVKAYGATGNGSTDDASAINSAISSLGSTGGIVFFPPSVYIVGSSITLPSKVILVGAGRGATILRAKPSTSVAVVETTNFSSLTGTNSTSGSYKFGLRSLSIDGNKANGSTGDGLVIYGFDFNLDDLEIYNCSNTCLYSEWGTSGTVPTSDGDSMEAHVHGLKTYGAGVDGIQWFGPHDSSMDDVQTFINGRYGLYVENTANYFGGGTMFSNFHSYGNANHGVLCNANIYCNGFESESNTGGDGIHIIDTDFGFFDARGVSVYNNSGDGFNITAGFATVAGIQAFNNTGNGIVVGAASTMSDVVSYSNGGMGVHVSADSWVFSAVRVFSNAGNGMQIDAPSTTNGVYTYMNGGHGLVINSSDATADGINAQNNTGTGIKINGTLQSLVVSGKASGNATQLDLGTVAAPSIIDVVTFNTVTPAGQTSYTGTPGDVFLRIGTAGTGALSSLNQVQT